MLVCAVTGNVNFDHLAKKASLTFFHHKVIYEKMF